MRRNEQDSAGAREGEEAARGTNRAGVDSPACPTAMSTPLLTRRSSADPPPSATATADLPFLLRRVVLGGRKILPAEEEAPLCFENARHLR